MEPTTTTTATSSAVGLRFGLLTGLISIIITFAINTLQLEASPLRYLTTLVLVAGIFLALRDFKQRNGGFMSYGQGVGIGTLLSAVVGVLSAVFTYVYTTFIDAGMVTRAMEKARADMEARGTMTDAQIDQAMAMSAKFTSGPFLLLVVIIGSIVIGLLISLVISAFIKNTKPEFE